MRTIILSFLIIGCVHAAPVAAPTMPNRVCTMVAFHLRDAKCTDAGTNALHGDVARVTNDGGSKMCWESFDQDGWHCATLELSKSEAAEFAVQQDRARAKQEADAKAKAETPKTVDPAKTVEVTKPAATPSNIPAKDAKKP